MYNEYVSQDAGSDTPEDLPTYGYLEEQERSNPNSRFGRWRGWIEKRAAERYADITDEVRERQRQRGWGATVNTDQSSQAPQPTPSIMSPMSAQLASERIGNTRLSVYQFGSKFIPHSGGRITSMVPLMDDRYLLLGGTDGMGFLDVFPDNDCIAIGENLMLHPLEGAKRRDLWTGEAIHQMSLLESYPDTTGGLQGVLLALVSAEETDAEREPMKSVRLYDLSSIYSLVKWTLANPDCKPVVVPSPKGWTHQHTTRRLHRPAPHAIARGLRSMVLESPNSGHGSRPGTPADSTPSLINSAMSTSSLASDRPSIPQHQGTTDSADSWDMVDDLPLRWATNYVNLSGGSSRLLASSVLFFETMKLETGANKGTWMLAVATKTCIYLYESPKNERSFRFVKEYYTPLPAKSMNFIHQSSRDPSRLDGERLRKERPVSRLPENDLRTSPRSKRISTASDPAWGPQLSLFVIFEKKAGLIRLADASVSELELWDDGEGDRMPPPLQSSSPQSLHSSHTISGILAALSSKTLWLPLVTVQIPIAVPPAVENSPSQSSSKTIALLSRGRLTHIISTPLPIPVNSRPPLSVIRWNHIPRQIAARLSGAPGDGREAVLQVIAFGESGIEVVETGLQFLFRQPDQGVNGNKGKGKVKTGTASTDFVTRATWDSPETIGYLGRGGYWNALDTSSGRPEVRQDPYITDPVLANAGQMVERGQGIYGWMRKGLDDYRVIWFGEDIPA